MPDPRFTRLSKLLVSHSMKVVSGEKVLIEAFDIPEAMTVALVREVAAAGGIPLVQTYHQSIQRALAQVATDGGTKLLGQIERSRMEQVQCYVGLRGSHNITEMSDVPRERLSLVEKNHWSVVHQEVRVPRTRWVVLRWPSPSMAQSAGMSTEAFEDFYFRVCADVDYARMERAARPLHELMDRTDRVHIKGPGTDLTFSKKGIPSRGCYGGRNIPDGELFSCPLRDSVEGTLQYNTETLYRGTVFNRVRLKFKSGRIVEASADSEANTAKLNEILDSDDGARYIGEFSLAFNPFILHPMRDTLFDEKIAGSFHFTPGQAYEDAGNGNKSQIHWDMVCIQRKDFGGGEIHFDNQLIRKDGLFTLPQLADLNPDKLGVA
jgi:aminopeptidase